MRKCPKYPRKAPRPKTLNVRLSADEAKLLALLCTHTGMTASVIVRTAIRTWSTMSDKVPFHPAAFPGARKPAP